MLTFLDIGFFRFNFKSALRNNLFLASIVHCRLLRKSQPKRDLKGFKCMTVSSDVLETFLRVIETFETFKSHEQLNHFTNW